MTHEYDDAVDHDKLEAAARGVLRRLLAECAVPLHDLAARAITETFCACVTGAEDVAEGQFSRIHTALIEEVVKRVQAVVADGPPIAGPPDVVDVASEQSFPASDAPAWVWRRETSKYGGGAR